MKVDNTVVLKRFESRIAAEIASAALKSHGIEAMLVADDCGGIVPSLNQGGGVELRVRHEDYASAQEALNHQAKHKTKGNSEIARYSKARKSWNSLFMVVFGFRLGFSVTFIPVDSGNRFAGEEQFDTNKDGAIDTWHQYKN